MIVPGEKFEIVIKRWKDSIKFKMNVECIHVSEQVLRFIVSGGQKEMIMEKQVMKKKHPWKITKMNFHFDGKDESVAMAIMNIQDAIDAYIDPPTPKNWYKA